VDPEKGCPCNRCLFIPRDQVGWGTICHGAFPELIPPVALKTAPGSDAIPNIRLYFINAVENLHI
jgi:hypothetical protein